MSEPAIITVRYVVAPSMGPYEGIIDPREALARALEDFTIKHSGYAGYWLTSNVLEAKVVPYEAER